MSTTPAQIASPMFGIFTRAGTFPIRDEETTGFVVSCTSEELRAVKHLPMYQRVAVVRADELERLSRYCSELEEQIDEAGLKAAQKAVFP